MYQYFYDSVVPIGSVRQCFWYSDIIFIMSLMVDWSIDLLILFIDYPSCTTCSISRQNTISLLSIFASCWMLILTTRLPCILFFLSLCCPFHLQSAVETGDEDFLSSSSWKFFNFFGLLFTLPSENLDIRRSKDPEIALHLWLVQKKYFDLTR